jgi:hypothetical protein
MWTVLVHAKTSPLQASEVDLGDRTDGPRVHPPGVNPMAVDKFKAKMIPFVSDFVHRVWRL